MKKLMLRFCAVALASLWLTGTLAFWTPTSQAQTPQTDGVRRITKEELSKLLSDTKSQVLVVDVRNPDSFKNGHVKGAINIPWGELARNLKRLPRKGALIVTYCS